MNKQRGSSKAKETSQVKRNPRTDVHEVETSATARATSAGRKRVSWKNRQKNVLTIFGVKLDPRYRYRIANDDPITGRIDNLLSRGYNFVSRAGIDIGDEDANRASNVGNYASQIVGSDRNGNPLRSYLMRIKREWYEEDLAEKEEAAIAKDHAIRGDWAGESVNDKYVETYSNNESSTLVARGTKVSKTDDEE